MLFYLVVSLLLTECKLLQAYATRANVLASAEPPPLVQGQGLPRNIIYNPMFIWPGDDAESKNHHSILGIMAACAIALERTRNQADTLLSGTPLDYFPLPMRTTYAGPPVQFFRDFFHNLQAEVESQRLAAPVFHDPPPRFMPQLNS